MIPVQKLADVMCSILEEIKPGDEITTYAFLYEKKSKDKDEMPVCEGRARSSSLRMLLVTSRDILELCYKEQRFARLRTACAIFWLALVMIWTLWRRGGRWV